MKFCISKVLIVLVLVENITSASLAKDTRITEQFEKQEQISRNSKVEKQYIDLYKINWDRKNSTLNFFKKTEENYKIVSHKLTYLGVFLRVVLEKITETAPIFFDSNSVFHLGSLFEKFIEHLTYISKKANLLYWCWYGAKWLQNRQYSATQQ